VSGEQWTERTIPTLIEKGIAVKSGFCAAAFLFMCMFLATPAHPMNIVFGNYDCIESGQAAISPSQRAIISAGVSKNGTGGLAGSAETGLQSRPNVLRQRMAFLNTDELWNLQNAESINVQLFGDVRLIASQGKVQKGRNDSLLWTGRLDGVEGGQIILVVRNGNVFASIYLPSSVFQIRPAGRVMVPKSPGLGGVGPGVRDSGCGASSPYIIRELKPDWKPEDGGRRTDGTVLTGSAKSLPGAGVALSGDENKIIALVNLEREAEGVSILRYNDRLTATARGHAQDMALYNYNSHDRRDGRKFWQSVFDNGYPVTKCGENIAVGQATPEEAFECLISSPGHRANIIDPDYKQIGVAHAVSPTSAFHHFWAQEFGAGDKPDYALLQGAAHSPLGLFASVVNRE
jgi:hypothetical protein